MNRLIANIRWGLLSNYLSSPTDCPQRDERMGWTADTQVFMNSAAYFADTSEFLGKYLADLRDAQRASGCYMCFVPNVRHTFPPWASAGWTDAGVIIPYRLWKWYGDRRFIDASWESMVRYMDFLEGNAEPYRINHGDWLAFEHHKKNAGDAMDGRQVKALNAYFRVWMAMLMREMAGATGRGAAERHYADEEAKLRQAFTAAYVGPDGTIKDEYKGQCNDLYMLKLGLCGGAAAVEATKRDLVDNIKACGNRLQTGFLGTAILMPTLTFEANAPELAYSLLLQDAFPSWLAVFGRPRRDHGVGTLERLHEGEGVRPRGDEQLQPLRLRLRGGVALRGGGRHPPAEGRGGLEAFRAGADSRQASGIGRRVLHLAGGRDQKQLEVWRRRNVDMDVCRAAGDVGEGVRAGNPGTRVWPRRVDRYLASDV